MRGVNRSHLESEESAQREHYLHTTICDSAQKPGVSRTRTHSIVETFVLERFRKGETPGVRRKERVQACQRLRVLLSTARQRCAVNWLPAYTVCEYEEYN
eukprot:684172-Prorocentrum_minimum.AAC.4